MIKPGRDVKMMMIRDVLCLLPVDMQAVAYLGFQKGGANVRWALVLTQRGGQGQTKFSNFFSVNKFFFAKGGHG